MSPATEEIPAATEQVYLPRPSWAPIFLAAGAALAIAGIYAQGFIVRGYIFSIIGAIVFVCALISLIGRSGRDFYLLPRRQRVRSAVLPAASLRSPKKG